MANIYKQVPIPIAPPGMDSNSNPGHRVFNNYVFSISFLSFFLFWGSYGGFMFCTIMCVLLVFIIWVARIQAEHQLLGYYRSRHTTVSYMLSFVLV